MSHKWVMVGILLVMSFTIIGLFAYRNGMEKAVIFFVPLLYAAGSVAITWFEVWFGKPGRGWALWRLVPPTVIGGLITFCLVVDGYAAKAIGGQKAGSILALYSIVFGVVSVPLFFRPPATERKLDVGLVLPPTALAVSAMVMWAIADG